jgi:hypothetical protein
MDNKQPAGQCCFPTEPFYFGRPFLANQAMVHALDHPSWMRWGGRDGNLIFFTLARCCMLLLLSTTRSPRESEFVTVPE